MRAAAAASASGLPGRAIQTPGRLACYRVRSKRVMCPIALLLLQFRHLSEADNGVAGIGDGVPTFYLFLFLHMAAPSRKAGRQE